ncbi:amino acid ABC transporter permease [Paracoccus sanguinis]|uniref:Amino acid ABC transporter membrane protein 2, PAAT family n=1 Tax=Paracoccus sanguinis TaxID=1545044 RepID=A0A1H3AQW2_9RHOB|nr:amino acid ABC transporter permease [Paracoccus sanguinis]SDX31524.1 amino acid ABC transporter membrane protein 2, PAAT family [Paracoccus sanguinis]
MDMTLDFSVLLRFTDALAMGLWTTIRLTLLCVVLGTALGFVIGLLRSGGNAVLRGLLGVYVEIFRGTPVLIQLFWIFFCLPLILGVELSNFVSATVALTLYMGAITSETFRASLRSVGREQLDACVALGLPRRAQIVNVIMPQAVLRAAPTLLSNAISLFKESALVSAVGMADLMFIGQNISNNTARPVEVLTAVAIIYFVIAFPLTRAVTVIEQKLLRKFSA